jgi:hypothetical protein
MILRQAEIVKEKVSLEFWLLDILYIFIYNILYDCLIYYMYNMNQ